MLAAKNRLPGYRIPQLLQRGQKYRSGPFSVYSLSTTAPKSRIGIVVPVRLSKKAVLRNRTKRLIRTVCQNYINTVHGGVDVLIITNTLFTGKKMDDIQSIIKIALSAAFSSHE